MTTTIATRTVDSRSTITAQPAGRHGAFLHGMHAAMLVSSTAALVAALAMIVLLPSARLAPRRHPLDALVPARWRAPAELS